MNFAIGIKNKIRDMFTPSIDHVNSELSDLRHTLELTKLELSKVKDDLTQLRLKNEKMEPRFFWEFAHKDEATIETNWRAYGDNNVRIDKIKEALHSPHLWAIYSHRYWLIAFSILINKGFTSLVDEFIAKFIERHGLSVIDKYLVVADYLTKTKVEITPEIRTASFVFNELKKQRENKTMLSFFSGKRIAIVGNGPSDVNRGLGAEIDSHDIVIRFNNYETRNFENDYGTKTNVWVRGSGGDDILEREAFAEYDMIIFEADYDHFPIHFDNLTALHKYISAENVECCNFDYESHLTLRKASGIDFPTTGLVTIWNIINIVGKDNVNLYGFSFLEQDSTWINNHYFNDRSEAESKQRTLVHNMKKEALFISKIYGHRGRTSQECKP